MTGGLHVAPVWRGYSVFDGARQIAGVHTCQALAEARMLDIAAARRRAAKIRQRACLCCGVEFSSEGAHNRLCKSCRTSSGLDRQMITPVGTV